MAEQTTTAVSPCGGFGGGGGAPAAGTGTGDAAAGAQTAPQGSMMGTLMPIAIFILIFYFMILRPQSKRKKQQEALMNGITRGDQIITVSGVFGTVREVREDSFVIDVGEGQKLRILKSAVQTKRNPTAAAAPEEKKD